MRAVQSSLQILLELRPSCLGQRSSLCLINTIELLKGGDRFVGFFLSPLARRRTVIALQYQCSEKSVEWVTDGQWAGLCQCLSPRMSVESRWSVGGATHAEEQGVSVPVQSPQSLSNSVPVPRPEVSSNQVNQSFPRSSKELGKQLKYTSRLFWGLETEVGSLSMFSLSLPRWESLPQKSVTSGVMPSRLIDGAWDVWREN